MKGSNIILTAAPRGIYLEGIIAANQTPVPGTPMQIANAAFNNGRPQWTPAAPGADGAGVLMAILLEDDEQGFIAGYVDASGTYHAGTAYVAGARCRLYVPLAGEEVNVLVDDGETLAIGGGMILDHTESNFKATTGSPASTPFVAMEAITVGGSDQLVWAMATGY